MLSESDNDLLCRVGPDTPMGQAMRRFWIPALMSSELAEPAGDPVHVELLNKDYVAFRDGEGNVGLLDEFCCHRGVSLTVGRVETCGLRCLYHGWLFAADGTVLETPNVQDDRFRKRLKANAYPVHEAGGLIWTYLGPKDQVPPLPDFPWINDSPSMRTVVCQINACNYVQMLEGLNDSSHLSHLHRDAIAGAQNSGLKFAQSINHMRFDVAPRIEAEEMPFGMHAASIRSVDAGAETRVTVFILPFWSLNPNGNVASACVPMTDTKTAFYLVFWDGEQSFGEDPLKTTQVEVIGLDDASLKAFGQTRSTSSGDQAMRRENGFRQNREWVRKGHSSGMPALALDDSLVAVSAGGLRSRRNEHLAPSDAAVAMMYKVMLKSAKRVASGGDPIGLGMSVNALRGTPATLPSGADWRTLVPTHFTAGRMVETS